MSTFIGYHNLLEEGYVGASSEASGFPVENAYDWRPYDFWKANDSAASSHWIRLDLFSAKAADYFMLHAYNLDGGTVVLQHSDDDAAYTDAFAALSGTGAVLFKTFVSASHRYWRVLFTGVEPTAGVIAFGRRLTLADQMEGFTPPEFARDVELLTNQSVTGNFLGQSVLRRGAEFSIEAFLMTPAFARTDWLPFMNHAEAKPFGIQWSDLNPTENAFVWAKDIEDTAYIGGCHQGSRAKLVGVTTGPDTSLQPVLEYDFSKSTLGPTIGVTALAFARASTGTYRGRNRLIQTAASGAARYEYTENGYPLGIVIEDARTSIALHNRNLANAAWTKTNVSAVQDQTGVDGVLNSASRITASAGNGTCLQAIINGSTARFLSADVKRLVGSGVIEMTLDNGSTWTPVTVTADWTRVFIPTQTLANPTVGFRIVTNGDSIAVDFVQCENGLTMSSRIATTTASVTRAAETCFSASLAEIFGAQGAIAIEATYRDNTSTKRYLTVDDNSASNAHLIEIASGGVNRGRTIKATVEQASVSAGTPTAGAIARIAYAWKVDDFAIVRDGGSPATDVSGSIPNGISRIRIGHDSTGASQMNTTIRKVRLYARRPTNAQLQAMTA